MESIPLMVAPLFGGPDKGWAFRLSGPAALFNNILSIAARIRLFANSNRLTLAARGIKRYSLAEMEPMKSQIETLPKRIFLDSSALQTLQDYGGYLYENEPLSDSDSVLRDFNGVAKLSALRLIMRISERAPFEFALSDNSFAEVCAKRDPRYLQWAYDVLDHWRTCLAESERPLANQTALAALDSRACGYLSHNDSKLVRDAITLDCDTFMTMENRLPKNAKHMHKLLGIRVGSPLDVWKDIEPWAALFC